MQQLTYKYNNPCFERYFDSVLRDIGDSATGIRGFGCRWVLYMRNGATLFDVIAMFDGHFKDFCGLLQSKDLIVGLH